MRRITAVSCRCNYNPDDYTQVGTLRKLIWFNYIISTHYTSRIFHACPSTLCIYRFYPPSLKIISLIEICILSHWDYAAKNSKSDWLIIRWRIFDYPLKRIEAIQLDDPSQLNGYSISKTLQRVIKLNASCNRVTFISSLCNFSYKVSFPIGRRIAVFISD